MGSNQFIALPTIGLGAAGPQPSIDLFTLVPPNGVGTDLTFILTGNFVGAIAVQGSVDGLNWAGLGQFDAGLGANELRNLDFPVLFVEHIPVKFLRAFVHGRIVEAVKITVGAEKDCDCGGSGVTGPPGIQGVTGPPGVTGVTGPAGGGGGGGADWESFRRASSMYPWNAANPMIINSGGVGIGHYTGLDAGQGDVLRAYPHVFPVAGTITKLQWYLVTNNFPGQGIRWAIYSDDGGRYPAQKLFDSGNLGSLSAGAIVHLPNLHTDGNRILWVVFNFNQAWSPAVSSDQTQTILWFDARYTQGLLGYDGSIAEGQLSSNNRGTFGWKIASDFIDGMPDNFPAGATMIPTASTTDNTNRQMPLIFFYFTAD